MKTLSDLFLHFLKDILYAEKQIVKTLPKMAKKASSPELKQAFEKHREESLEQIERLEKVFEILGKPAKPVTCEAIQGIIEESTHLMEDAETPEVLDAALIAAAQAVEHYEITRYGTLCAWAKQLGMKDALPLLQQTLDEEKKTDDLLSKLGQSNLNQKAAA